MTNNFAFFTGCFIPVRQPHIEYITRKVMPELGVELHEIKGFTCCPEPVAFGLQDRLTSLAIAARNISLVEKRGLDIMTVCNGCYFTLKHATEELRDRETRYEVNKVLAETGHEYKGTSEIKHFIQVLKEDVGLDAIRNAVKKPLNGLNVATHTGCHFSNRMGKDVNILDELVTVLGANVIDYEDKNLCCGWTLGTYGQVEAGYTWLKNRINNMRDGGADCVVVICPQCLQQFDMGQLVASRKVDISHKLTPLFYLQLLGLAMGYSLDDMQYGANKVKDSSLDVKLKR